MSYTRTNIYLTEPQKRALEEVSMDQGLTMAELVRRIIDQYLKGMAREG